MSEANYKHELVGAMGFPIAENPTGIMMEAAFKACGLNWRYQLLEVAPEKLKDAVNAIRTLGFIGSNFTIPHKVAVREHLDGIAADAAIIGAVNTIRREGDRFIGENTDGKGFLTALAEAGVPAAAEHVTVLGAGGAARAITVELALAGSKRITIINRSAERGQTLAQLLQDKTPAEVSFESWTKAHKIASSSEILVNATSIALYPNVNDRPDINYDSIHEQMLVCDVIPNPPRTPFLVAAAQRGAKTLDGLAMLVYQGAIAFKMWTGKEAPTAVMQQALQEVFGV